MITDLTPYRQYVDQFDLTEEQKLELVNAVWSIVESIYDHCLGVNQLRMKEKTPKKTIDKVVQFSSIGRTTLNASKRKEG